MVRLSTRLSFSLAPYNYYVHCSYPHLLAYTDLKLARYYFQEKTVPTLQKTITNVCRNSHRLAKFYIKSELRFTLVL